MLPLAAYIGIVFLAFAHELPYSGKISRGLTFAFFTILAKSRKFIREIFSFAKFLSYIVPL